MIGRLKRPFEVRRGLLFRMATERKRPALTLTVTSGQKVLAGLFVAFAILSFIGSFDSAASGSRPLVLYFVRAILFLVGLRWLVYRLDVKIADGTVRIARRGLFGTRRFEEPLAAYRGVRYRRFHTWKYALFEPRLFALHSVALQRLELDHPDPARTVPLFQSRDFDTPRKEWEAYAKAFGLPAIQEDGSRLEIRAAGDLDKSLGERAREGTMDGLEGPGRPPPRSLCVHTGQERIEIEVLRPPIRSWLIFALLLLPAALGFRVLLGFEASNLLVFGLGAALALGGAAVSRLPWRRLVIFKDRIEWHVRGLLGWSHETIRLRDAESAILVRGGRFGRKRLRIEGDKVALEIGQGLKTRDLEWLRDYLIYAAVRA